MDPTLHKAAMEGQLHVFSDATEGKVGDARTPNGNTVLHVATQFGHLSCVKLILKKCPDLLHRVNSKGETALHIAARGTGISDVVKDKDMVEALVDWAKKVADPESAGGTNNTGGLSQMLRAVNEDGDTALHLVARRPFGFQLVELLTAGDSEFEHPPNKAQETPLFLACETASVLKVYAIFKYCRSPAYSGPGGKTALHAAVTRDISSMLSGEMVEELLNRRLDLVREPDEYGWTPLHYAARNNNVKAISQLLDRESSVAYIGANNDDYNTALHIAAAQEFIGVMEKILSYCPDCWEVVNGKGQNIYHIAAEMEKNTLLSFLKKQIWSKYLLNQKDTNGNTPLHLLASSVKKRPFFLLGLFQVGDWRALNRKNLAPYEIALKNDVWTIVMLDDFQIWRQRRMKKDEKMKKDETLNSLVGSRGSTTINDPKDRPIGILGWRNVVNDDRERMKILKEEEKMNEDARINTAQVERFRKMADAHLIVATLIATVTFAATFTLPGGYDSEKGKNQGTAILLRKAAFKVFIISNTVAVATSTAAVFLHVAASLYDDKADLLSRYRKAFHLILIAILAMVLAFVTGIYVILAPSLSLATASCAIIGSFSFPLFYWELVKMDFFSNLWFLMTQQLAKLFLQSLAALMIFLEKVIIGRFTKGERS